MMKYNSQSNEQYVTTNASWNHFVNHAIDDCINTHSFDHFVSHNCFDHSNQQTTVPIIVLEK